jgi:curved DNA-binding protein CbpA
MAPSSEIPFKGTLQDVPLQVALSFPKRGKKSGRLTIYRNGVQKSVHFQEGKIIFASSSYPNDRLAEVFLRAGKINFKQYVIAEEIFEKHRSKKGMIFLEQKFIAPKDLFEMLSLQVKEIVLSLFPWQEAQYSFLETKGPQEEAIGIAFDPYEIVREGLYNISDWTRLIQWLPPLDSILLKNTDASSDYLLGSNTEKEIASFVNNERSIQDILMLSSTQALSCAQTLNLFIATGFVSFRQAAFAPRHDSKKPETKSERKGLAKDHKEEAKKEEAIVLEEPKPVQIKKIRELYASIEMQNYYQILGVANTASSAEVKRAYFKLAKKYHPDSYTDPDFLDVIKAIETIFVHVARAYEVLSVESKRAQYDQELKDIDNKTHKEPPIILSVNGLRDRAEKAIRENDLKNALYFLEEIIRIIPEDHEDIAAVYLRYGQVLARIPGQLHPAAEAFKRSSRLSPSNAQAHLELGSIFNKAGLINQAVAAFNEALKREPNNKAAQEALQNLKK